MGSGRARFARWFPLLVLIAGLIATGASTFAFWNSAETRKRLAFLHATDIELRTIQDQFSTYTAVLRGAAGLFAASEIVTLSEFRAYVARIEFQERYPGILGIGFTRILLATQQEQLSAEVRAQGVSNFKIHPVTGNPLIGPVIFAEPPNPRNQAAIGFDVMSEPLRRDMIERARDTGRSAASARIQLVQEIDKNKQAGFLVATPVYAGSTIPSSADEKKRLFQGFIFGAFRADDLFSNLVAPEAEEDAAFAIYDGTPSEATLLHRSASHAEAEGSARYRREATLELGGRKWTVVFASRATARRSTAASEAWFAGAVGLLATILLSLAAYRQRQAQEAIHQLNASLEARVEERTRDLQLANNRLREAGEERAIVEEQLRQSQKMEAVGQLTGGLAHDFNNLLAGISGALEMMSSRIGQGRLAEVEKYIVAAQGATRRAAALTHRLLAFSRRQTLAPKPTNVNHLVHGMLDLIQRTVGPSIHVETASASALWAAMVDPPQLENALLNLCINARDAMPSGGRITIETANQWMDDSAGRERDLPAGQYLSLCVTDIGTGMPPEVVARAFDPFFTTKPLGQGTGLGLSMIYGFAKQSGGQVRIVSEVGRGTTVCLYLPRYHGEADADVSGLLQAPKALAELGETVLVVDDEPTVRLLVMDVLEDLGYSAIEAADSVEGLKLLQSNVHIDLLITDVGLPGGLNGRQLADAGRQARPNLKVLFITGYAENAVINAERLAPGMAVLTKPFAVDALAARIREIIAA